MLRPPLRSPLRSGRSFSGGDAQVWAVLVGMMAAAASVGSPGSAASNSIANFPGLNTKLAHVQWRAKQPFTAATRTGA